MKVLPRWWRAHFLWVELALAVLTSLLFVTWVEVCDGEAVVQSVLFKNRAPLYGTLASIFGSLLGFSITAVAIVLGFASHDRLTIVRQSQRYEDLWRVFTSAIRALALATVAALAGLVLDRDSSPAWPVLYGCAFATVLSLLRIARVVWILEKVIHVVTRHSPKKE